MEISISHVDENIRKEERKGDEGAETETKIRRPMRYDGKKKKKSGSCLTRLTKSSTGKAEEKGKRTREGEKIGKLR